MHPSCTHQHASQGGGRPSVGVFIAKGSNKEQQTGQRETPSAPTPTQIHLHTHTHKQTGTEGTRKNQTDQTGRSLSIHSVVPSIHSSIHPPSIPLALLPAPSIRAIGRSISDPSIWPFLRGFSCLCPFTIIYITKNNTASCRSSLAPRQAPVSRQPPIGRELRPAAGSQPDRLPKEHCPGSG